MLLRSSEKKEFQKNLYINISHVGSMRLSSDTPDNRGYPIDHLRANNAVYNLISLLNAESARFGEPEIVSMPGI